MSNISALNTKLNNVVKLTDLRVTFFLCHASMLGILMICVFIVNE